MMGLGKLSDNERKAIQPTLDKIAELRIEAERDARREYCPFCRQYRTRKKVAK